LWDEELPWLPVKMAKDCHNLHHGLTLLRRSKDYYDMIAVAMPDHRLNAASYYLNKLKSIEQFIQSFEQNNKDLLGAVMPDRIALPEQSWDRNLHKIILQKNRFVVPGGSYVTSQELACLRLLLSGLTHKEIAATLTLSARSVETYIGRAKLRTGRHATSALRDMLSACP
jgi:DNA-binding CsgD family transcriptional regulator